MFHCEAEAVNHNLNLRKVETHNVIKPSLPSHRILKGYCLVRVKPSQRLIFSKFQAAKRVGIQQVLIKPFVGINLKILLEKSQHTANPYKIL
jgi:hypothetical protein